MTQTFQSKFEIGKYCYVDGDKHLKLRIIGMWFQSNRTMVEVAWFTDSAAKEAWIEEWRLEHAE